eukprot:EST49190.1 Transmembrane domain-containing protein [Spironucleus salmonicida]
MFQVSSLLLLIPGQGFSYRVFTALFTCNHPDTLMLSVFMLYLGRAFEFHRGLLATLALLVVSIFTAVGISFVSYFGGEFVVQYTMIVPAAFASAALFHTESTWSGAYKLQEKTGLVVLLILALTNRFQLQGAVFVALGILVGGIVGCLGRVIK